MPTTTTQPPVLPLSDALPVSPLSSHPPTLQFCADVLIGAARDASLVTSRGTLLYLAYGSNMCAQTFLGKRGIKPLQSFNVLVPELKLVFDLPGVCYAEPRFANVRVIGKENVTKGDGIEVEATESTSLLEKRGGERPAWDDGLIGVCYEVTLDDYAQIRATEGPTYRSVACVCTKIVPPGSSDAQSETITALTLCAPPSAARKTPGDASLRYLNLLRAGAVEHDLPEEYKQYLDSLHHYAPVSLRQKIGKVVWQIGVLPFFTFYVVITKATGGTTQSKFVQWGFKAIFAVQWWMYDHLGKYIFGDGETWQGDEEDNRGELGSKRGEMKRETSGSQESLMLGKSWVEVSNDRDGSQ